VLLPKFLNPEILLEESPAAKHESFAPPLPRQALALLVDIKVIFLLVPDKDRLAPATHAHDRDGERHVGRPIGQLSGRLGATIAARVIRVI
jgi:hypothetical protein